jgi:hypothetical protein
MAEVLLTVEGNEAPDIFLQLKRNGQPINLTGLSVDLLLKDTDTDTVVNTGHQGCTLGNDSYGVEEGGVSYSPASGDLPANSRLMGAARINHVDDKPEILYEQVLIIVRAK